MLSSEFSATFAKVKPLCASIASNPHIEDILQLEGILKESDDKFIQVFQDYLLFPFTLNLLKKNNEKINIKAIDMVAYIFNRSSLNDWSTFSNTFMQIFTLVCHPTEFGKVIDSSEEFKSSVCLCISSIFMSASKAIHKAIYEPTFRLPLAQAIHTLLGILKHERSKPLRKIVLHTVGVLCYSPRLVKDRSTDIEDTASDCLAAFFPGLTCTLSNIISGDIKQGYTVIEIALNLLGDVIVLVVGDQCTIADSQTVKVFEPAPGCIIKDNKWFKEVADKLQIFIEKNLIVLTHSWKIHKAFLEFSELILFKCSKNLEKCIVILLPAIFSLLVSEINVISSLSQKLISKFSEKFQALNSLSLLSMIEENIYSIASKLLTCKLSNNDDETLFVLKSVLGFLTILGSSVDNLLVSFSHLERLILSILSLLKFDTSDIGLMTEYNVDVNTDSFPILPRKRFRYFQKEDILLTICNICHCLGKNTHSRLLIGYLIEKTRESEFSLESIFLIGCTASGLPVESKFKQHSVDLVEEIIEELLQISSLETSEATSIQTVQIWNDQSSNKRSYDISKVHQICLTLETFEKCAKALGKEFHKFLIKVLFYVLQNAGSCNYMLSLSGKLCLYGIAESCCYNPRVELIRENADYLVNSITLNFHHFLYRPEATAILRVVLEESDAKMLPLFRDIVDHILNMLDYNQDMAIPLLSALKSVEIFINKWFPVTKTVDSDSATKSEKYNENLKLYFLNKSQKGSDNNSVNVHPEEIECKTAEENNTTGVHMEKLKAIISQNKDVQEFVDKFAGKDLAQGSSEDTDQASRELADLLEKNQELGNFIKNTPADSLNLGTKGESHNSFEKTEEKVIPLHITLSSEILKRCSHLQSSKSRQLRVLALEVMELCLVALGDFEEQQHPLIHELWNPLVDRFSEENIIVFQAFKVLLLIADEARDFIQARCLKTILPKLISLLSKGFVSSCAKNYPKYQYSNDCKLHIFVLSEVGCLYTKFDVLESHIAKLVEVCLPYLQKTHSKAFQEAAYKTLKYIAKIDSDALWFYYNQLYCDDHSLIPPHNTLKVLHFPHSSLDSYHFDF